MALAKAGGGVTDLRGSISGNTFSRNRGGMIVRTRTVPTNTRSSSQSKSRSLFAYLTASWNKNLTPPQRTAWATYAHAVSSKNKLSEGIHLTGQLQFIRTNQVRMTAGMSLVTDGPSVLSLPETDPTLAIAGETQPVFAVTFDESQAWRTEDGGAISIVVSQPQPATKNYFTGPWRFAGAILGSSASPPTSPAVLSLPFPVTAGQKLFARACILRADGRTTNPFDLAPKTYTAITRLVTTNSVGGYKTFLRSLSGTLIQNYTSYSATYRIHHDPLTNTLWTGQVYQNRIANVRLAGTSIDVIQTGTVTEANSSIDAAAIDTRDGTLWVNNDKSATIQELRHYKRHIDGSDHYTLIQTFDIHTIVGNVKDVCFDSSDNSVWMTDDTDKKVYHISTTTGLELPGTIDMNALGVPLGSGVWCCEYDPKDNTLWVGCFGAAIYHITKSGILLETISLPDDPTGPIGCTLAPTSIQG